MTLRLIKLFNTLFAALLAGISVGIWMGFDPADYSSSTYLEQQQNLLRSLNGPLIALVALTTVLTLLSAFFQRKDRPAMVALLLAAAFFISCMLITRMGNVPVQLQILKWTPDTMPANWTALRDQWWSFHIMRAIVEVIALALVIWSLVQKREPARS